MEFKRFKGIVFFYIVLIVVLTISGVYIVFETYFWLTSIWIFAVDIFLIWALILFVNREYRKLSGFLSSIEQEDFDLPYSRSFKDADLNHAFSKLSNVIASYRDKAYMNYQYLQTIIDHTTGAIVCIDKNDKIVIANKSARKLFNKNVLRNINSLRSQSEDLPQIIRELKPGEKRLIKFNIGNNIFNYSLQKSEFKQKKEVYKLISFLNVQTELEQNELESWQKLTRVITHEIMNSAIPISNLSGLVYGQIFDGNDNFNESINQEAVGDIKEGLKTIENRSKGLVNFVDATRNFTKMPKPEFEKVSINFIIDKVLNLLKPKFLECNISICLGNDTDYYIVADKLMIEQVLINLLLNAVESFEKKDDHRIDVVLEQTNDSRILLSITDNGKGITGEQLDKIFIPFYTTKENGSGVGLSLAKQIMFLHKGNISVESEVNMGTTFCLSF
jgi:nitrogen fixation/metabolism regulation signal transduction histidine kinase